ncbi:MAG: peptidoglycan-binding protein [Bacteroidota bacterium]
MAQEAFYIFSYSEDPSLNSPPPPDQAYTFKADINPTKWSHKGAIKFDSETTPSNASQTNAHKGYDGDGLDVELLLDGTVIYSDDAKTVKEQVEQLYKSVYNFDGEVHQPRYLIVSYGEFGFKCKLENINVEYQLFTPEGEPIRAKVSLSFKGAVHPKASELAAHKRSPDLTRILTVRQGDTLPIMCDKLYKSPHYYLQVAEINGLTNFRELEIGAQILFPPLEK